jgi:hypothetical protein
MTEAGKITEKRATLLTMRQTRESTYVRCIVNGQDLGVADWGEQITVATEGGSL